MAHARGGVNDFVIKIGNVNGTGSASANGLLMRSIFRMGVPVTGKNFFPSNIQGLPTWYEIRVSGDGYLCASGYVHIVVAMNAQTYAKDFANVEPGGTFIYDSTWPRDKLFQRDDVTVIGIPLAQMCNERYTEPRTRVLMKNIAYFGALVALLDIDMTVVETLIQEQFGERKQHLVASNLEAIKLGYDYAKDNLNCPLPTRVEALDKTAGHVMMNGNTTAGLGAVFAGATVGAWYPITPSTSLMDAFGSFCHQFRINKESGEKNFCIVQAEDELGAAAIVLGGNWSGARTFTATSGPGVSLMSEILGYASFSEVPMVLFDVQRSGPSTGLPTRTQQSDLISAAYASHGDTRHALLFPADPKECFDQALTAFDAAERLQTPVIVLSDLDIGMNDWMIPALEWDESYVPDRGKVLDADALEKITKFERYADPDGDGIPYRTLPGVHPEGGFFTRGSGHNEAAQYSEDGGAYVRLMNRLKRKLDGAPNYLPAPVLQPASSPTTTGIIAYGSSHEAVREALAMLTEDGRAIDYLRVRSFPFGRDVQQFLDAHEQVFVVEQNRDGQMRTLLLNELDVEKSKMVPVLHFDGMPITSKTVAERLNDWLAEEAAA